MNGKHLIIVMGDNSFEKMMDFFQKMKDCICVTPDEGVEFFKANEKIDNVVFYYLTEDEGKCNPVEVVTTYFQCVKKMYREILVHRGINVWFSLLSESEDASDGNIANSGIRNLAKTFGLEVEKRKIPVNCMGRKGNDTVKKILMLLEYSMEQPIYLNLQTI